MQLQLHLNAPLIIKRLILPIALLGLSLAMVLTFNLLLNRPHLLAQQGVMQLDVWSPDRQEKVLLAGEWSFFWDEFIQPKDLKQRLLGNDQFVFFPGVWTDLIWEGQEVPTQGRASAILHLQLPADQQRYSLKIPALTANYRLWVNGQEKVKNDDLDNKIQRATGQTQARIVDFEAQPNEKGNSATLLFHLSNYHSKTGGIWEALFISTAAQREVLRSFNVTRDVVTSFALCLCAVILVWMAWQKQRIAYVFLACWAGLMAVRAGTIEERLLFEIFGIHDWEYQRKWEYGILYCTVPFFALYLGYRFPRYFPSILHWMTTAVLGALVLLILVTPAVVYSQTIWIFQGVVLLYAILWFGALVEFAYEEPKHGGSLLLGSLVFIAAAVNDILYTNNLINSINISQMGALFFLACGYFLYRLEEREAKKQPQHTPVLAVVDDTEQLLMTEEDRRELIADSMRQALDAWLALGKTKIDLAEQSGLWRITNDDGTLKTRTLDKYLKASSLPKNPRVATVIKTLKYVAAASGIDEDQHVLLQARIQSLNS